MNAIKMFLYLIDYRILLWNETEFYAELNGALRFSIYRAHKFLRKDKCFLKMPLYMTKSIVGILKGEYLRPVFD